MFDKYHPSFIQVPNAKPGTPTTFPSKAHIVNWLRTMFPDLPIQLKIEEFGNGVIYCRIINHYYPGTIPPIKILMNPKNQYEFSNNLKHVQQALVQHNIKIHFDVNKVVKRKFLQNWALINAIYKHLTSEQSPEENSISGNMKATGKRTYDMAFPEPQYGSATKHQPQTQQQMNHSFNYMVPVWQRNSLNLCFNNSLTPNPHNSLKMNSYFRDNANCSPVKGKWSVNSNMFQNNQNAVIDRIKEILLKNSHDTQKIRQIKMLLNIPIEEQEVIKIEEDDQAINHIVYNQSIKNSSVKKVIHEVKQEKQDDLLEKVDKEKNHQSETNPQKSQNKDKSGMKQRKPFKV